MMCILKGNFPKILPLLCTGFLYQAVMMSSYGQGFPCDGSFYYISTDKNEESRLYQVVVHPGDQTFNAKEIPLKIDRKRHITCLGYNVKDRRLYGLDFNSYELLRIDFDGAVTNLGVPDNLDTTFQYYAGDMTADGRRLMVVARNPATGIDERMYSIQVNDPPKYYAGFFPVVSDIPVALSDIAVDPVVGYIYGFDYIHGQIVATNRSGATTSNHSPFPIDKVKEGFGALFFDRFGQLYGLGSSSRTGGEQNTLYGINKSRGGSEKIIQIPGGVDTDGCGCPFTIQFWKTIPQSDIVGCEEVTIEYTIVNHAGIGQVSTRIVDVLPDILTINDLKMENLFNVQVKSGVGSNLLDIDQWTLVLGENKLLVTVDAGVAAPGLYGSQAQLGNLPLAFNDVVVSDDPKTSKLNDETNLTVIDGKNIRIIDYSWSSCDLDTMFLTVPLTGEFQWSNGSTQQILPVLADGHYALTVQSDCLIYADSIEVKMPTEPLFMQLGDDIYAQLGQPVDLHFNTNAKEVHLIEWSASENLELSCYDCQSPRITATTDGSVLLTISDERGCAITDEIKINVDETKRIFSPTGFSPNADGFNDRFMLFGASGKVKRFQIFDRWGNQVFDQSNLELGDESSGWDGTRQGIPVTSGVYLWFVEILFPDQIIQQFSGELTLVR